MRVTLLESFTEPSGRCSIASICSGRGVDNQSGISGVSAKCCQNMYVHDSSGTRGLSRRDETLVLAVVAPFTRESCRIAIARPIAYPATAPTKVSDAQCSPSAIRPTPIAVA